MTQLFDTLRPTLCLDSVVSLTPDLLRETVPDAAGVAFDLDKTLAGQHELGLTNEHMEALANLSEARFALGIISNAASQVRTNRVRVFANDIGETLCTKIAVVTSHMVAGKKKPLRPVFDRMSTELGIENRCLIYVGDQLLKDVLGANRAGYGGSVLVAPYGSGDDPRVRFLQRPIEAALRPLVGMPFWTKNFGVS